MSEPLATQSATQKAAKNRARMNLLVSLTLVGLLLLMWVMLAFTTNTFASEVNFTNLLRQGAMIAVLAVGETFVIITAGIDLSVGSVAGFATVIIGLLLQNGVSITAAIFLTLAMGVLIGAFHGVGIVRMGLPPFIMTLATLTSLRGLGFLLTNASTISITNADFTTFSRGTFLWIPNLFWIVIVVAIPAYLLLHQTRWGRYLYAIGSNKEAARLSGVDVNRITYLAYILSATLASVVGIMLASRLATGTAGHATGWELQAIAASVIGGTSLFGAVGSIQGPLLGALILATIKNGANLLNVNSFWQEIITGLLIIVIVYSDNLRRKKS